MSPRAEVMNKRDLKQIQSQKAAKSSKRNSYWKAHALSFDSGKKHANEPLEGKNKSLIPSLCKRSMKNVLMKLLHRKKKSCKLANFLKSFNKARSWSPPDKRAHWARPRMLSCKKKNKLSKKEKVPEALHKDATMNEFEENNLNVFGEARHHKNRQFDNLIPKVMKAKVRCFHCDSRVALCQTLQRIRFNRRQ